MTPESFLAAYSIRDVSQIGAVDLSGPVTEIDGTVLSECLRLASKIKTEGLTLQEISQDGSPLYQAVDVGLNLPLLRVKGDLILANIKLPFPVYFSECVFESFIEFWSSSCRSIGMYGCTLEQGMDMRSSKIDGHLFFRKSVDPAGNSRKNFICKGPFLLRDCTIAHTLDLTDAECLFSGGAQRRSDAAEGEAISLSRTTANAIYWRSVKIGNGGKVNLRDVSVKSFVNDIDDVELASWPDKDRLILDGFKYERIPDCPPDRMMKWIDLQEDVAMSSLSNLAAAYSNINSIQNAETVLVELKKLELGQVKNRLSRWLQRAVFWLVGYGVNPLRAFGIFLFMFLIFLALAHTLGWSKGMAPNVNSFISSSCFTGQSGSCGAKKFAELEPITYNSCLFETACPVTRYVPKHYPDYNPVVFSLEAFLPFIDFGQKKYWEVGNTLVRFLMVLWSYLAIFVGGVFVGGISGILTPRAKK